MILIRHWILALALIACCSTAVAQGVTPFCDLLYWHASEEPSAVWSNAVNLYPAGSSFSAETMQFDWSPGFRVGFGHQADKDSWDAKLYWTYFRTSQDAAVSGDIVIPEFFSGAISGDGRDYNAAAIDWNLTYNTIDLEAGRKFAVGESAWIRPSMGIKTAVIRQRIQLGLANAGLGSARRKMSARLLGHGAEFRCRRRVEPAEMQQAEPHWFLFSRFPLWPVEQSTMPIQDRQPAADRRLRRGCDQHERFVPWRSGAEIFSRSSVGPRGPDHD